METVILIIVILGMLVFLLSAFTAGDSINGEPSSYTVQNYGFYRIQRCTGGNLGGGYSYQLWYGGALWAEVVNRNHPPIQEWIHSRESDVKI